MGLRQWFRPPRQALVWFLAITLGLVAALVWQGWRILEQDRALETQRTLQHVDHAADHMTAVMQRVLAELEDQLLQLSALPGAKAPPRYAFLVVASPDGVQVYPPRRLLYYPILPRTEEPPVTLFVAGESAEYQGNDPAAAVELFRALAHSRNAGVRAGALLRLGRNLRKAGRRREALQAYDELAALGSTSVDGLPAELVAREAHCRVWEELHRREELKREAEQLDARLHGGQWRLSRAAWEFYASEVRAWLGTSEPAPGEQEAALLAAAVDWLWGHWQSEPVSKGRRYLAVGQAPLMLAWEATGSRLAALVSGPEYLAAFWDQELKTLPAQAALTDAGGQVVLGRLDPQARPQVVRGPAATRLPWTLQVARSGPAPGAEAVEGRRRLLLLGLVIVALLVAGASYFIFQAITHELSVARLQSDFVAVVSHEFRTPLTSLRQLSELLAKDRVPEPQRQRTYDVLAKETERLQRLVEELLDFTRMEAGVTHYHFETVETGELLDSLVAGFQHHVAAQGYSVEFLGAARSSPHPRRPGGGNPRGVEPVGQCGKVLARVPDGVGGGGGGGRAAGHPGARPRGGYPGRGTAAHLQKVRPR